MKEMELGLGDKFRFNGKEFLVNKITWNDKPYSLTAVTFEATLTGKACET